MRSRRRSVDIDSLESLTVHLRTARSMRGWRVQDLDLHASERELLQLPAVGAVFLGCDMSDAAQAALIAAGAVVFPDVPDVPIDAYRTSLYSAAELLNAPRYQDSLDARVYAWSRSRSHDVADATAAVLHDHAIDQALTRWCANRRIVGVMGGHAVQRGSATYSEAAALGRALAMQGCTVATGGGPGAMEAANLGARATSASDQAFADALRHVATAPSFADDIDAWVRTGFEAAETLGDESETLGIPTWFYGHEPPNALQSVSAKFFGNAVREDVLLNIATAGLVVLPGAGGTVQEIFQDACQNYYADDHDWAPVALVGRDYWTKTLPAWPLLEALMRDRAAAAGLRLVDSAEEASAWIDEVGR